ncbi:aminopeptidase N [Halobacteriovorax marinus]|uniref:aminopeptidase N n=1 Tax=Halobacteriovorax marinus TaxID=97084 RepID=UPI003A946117
MKDASPQTIFLKDYTPSDYLISKIHLTFDLDDTNTQVVSKMNVSANYDFKSLKRDLVLNGEELTLNKIFVDGVELGADQYELIEDGLVIKEVKEEFILEIHNTINPLANKALDGLYKSGSIFCTQNEPEGFRRITYFIDRPDIMAVYTTKVIADKAKYPVLLSNGNPIDSGDLEGGKHFVEWLDPFVKPSYLYALVAGDLGLVQDEFTTMSGRKIDLRIYVDKGNESKCDHAMESLKNSMRWDEEVYGREYDLDIYMIVAVDAFNMGAMENKGLNIFNSAYVLADPKTATDSNFFGVEGVIGHEYFHNWTGNRITCRDWFQLTLKEGLTVFRDQEFSSDMNSRVVNRIANIKTLKSRQFVEDAGPTAHPIKPSSYIEINNFYTMTIYEKGSEVIRMIHTLLGADGFRKGTDKYFELFDGQAVTTEDFIHAMSVANDNYDFTQFKNWYHQAGTPMLDIKTSYNEAAKEYSITVTQSCKPTPGQDEKKPYHMPFGLGLVSKDGADFPLKLKEVFTAQPQIEENILHLTQESETFTFTGIDHEPVPSFNRGFSAPVNLKSDRPLSDFVFLMANDNDEYNRYESAQALAIELMSCLVKDAANGVPLKLDAPFIKAYGELIKDESLDNSFKALILDIPSEGILHQAQDVVDFENTFKVRKFVKETLAKTYEQELSAIYDSLNVDKEYSLSPEAMGERELKNLVLGLLLSTGNSKYEDLAYEQFVKATNMTDEFAALTMIIHSDSKYADEVIEKFFKKWKHETLVMQKWLTAQASARGEKTLGRVKELLSNEVYDKSVPNLVRSLIGTFTANYTEFHKASGVGYEFITNQIIDIDKLNPQMASRLAGSFKDYKRLPSDLKALVKTSLERILAEKDISRNVYEIVSKTHADS